MKSIFEYTVVQGSLDTLRNDGSVGSGDFIPKVQKHLDEGWVLVGGASPFGHSTAIQAMKRENRSR